MLLMLLYFMLYLKTDKTNQKNYLYVIRYNVSNVKFVDDIN